MLRLLRGLTNTWPARVFFIVLAAAFALWGVASRSQFGSDPTAIATVGGTTVDPLTIQDIYTHMLAQLRRSQPDVTAGMRREVAQVAAQQASVGVALTKQADRLGIVAPDQAIRDMVFAVPGFRGPNGQFDRATMERVLTENHLTVPRYEANVRAQIATSQLLQAVEAGATGSALLDRHVYAALHETRQADAVDVLFAAQPAPAPATDAQLHRWVDNHPELYSTPEYRHIKTIILTPEEIAKTVDVSDAEIATAFDQHLADFQYPERRTVDVITAPDEPRARELAAQWRSGADWSQMQTAATAAGATATELPDTSRADLPFPELADAVFAQPEHAVGDPVHGALGWYVASVAKITPPGTKSLADVRDVIKQAIARDKASELLFDRARHVDDLLTGGTTFEALWSELGLTPSAGTLDRTGHTESGMEAPIPAPAPIRDALIAAAFAANKGDQPRLIPVVAPGAPAGAPPIGDFAVMVDNIIPPAGKPFADVADTARADYNRDQISRAANAVAAKMLASMQGGQTLAQAADAAKLPVRQLPPVGRGPAPADVPAELAKILFGLKAHDPAMVQTHDGFVVAQLESIDFPDPAADDAGLAAVRQDVDRAIASDTVNTYARSVLLASDPHLNPAQLDALARSAGAN